MANEGPNSPGTMADDDTVGTLEWADPDNAKVSDNIMAIAGTTSTKVTHYLKATNFVFGIPVGSTIDGIIVEIERRPIGVGDVVDSEVKIIKGGIVGSENKAKVGDWELGADIYYSYGAANDLWSENWTYADINDSGFGVVLSVSVEPAGGNPTEADVDHIRITVYYTEMAYFLFR